MAVYVLGAPGSGKSTVRPELASLLPDRIVLDWDDLIDAAGALASADIRRTSALWPAYRELVRVVVEATGPSRVVLLGVSTPDELPGWPIDEWVLLDCDDDERRRRLASRRDDEETTAAISDAHAYRALGLRAIDTTQLTPEDVARAVAAMVASPG